MEKKINLFKKSDSYAKLDAQLRKVNYGAIIVCTILLLFFLGLFGYNYTLQSKTKELTAKKQSLTRQLGQSDTQFRLNYISSKADTIKQFSKDDSHFITYYNLVKDLLDQNGMPALEEFSIDNAQKTTFSFTIHDYAELQKVMAFVESKDFASKFISLTVSNASFSAKDDSSASTLEFSGVMKDVNTTT